MYGASCMALFSMLYFLLFYDSVTCRVRGINVVAVDLELCMQSKSCREAASYWRYFTVHWHQSKLPHAQVQSLEATLRLAINKQRTVSVGDITQ